jgi:hypothetical protein
MRNGDSYQLTEVNYSIKGSVVFNEELAVI